MVGSTRAQTTSAEMLADPLKCGGVYMPYPESFSQPTAPPVGFEPFYVSHYGRHGSRYLVNDSEYHDLYKALTDARTAGLLTELGNDVTRRMENIWAEAEGRGGELSPLGYRQHRGIASRLLAECPGIFDDAATVTANSTVIMRCAHSMFAFLGRIKEFNPRIEIPTESSWRNMSYMSYLNPEASAFNDAPGGWKDKLADFKAKMTQPDRLVASLFANPADVDRYMPASDLMWALYYVAIDLPDMECGERLYDIFTADELFALWQVFNYRFYTSTSCNPESKGAFLESAKNLLGDIVTRADQYVAEGRHGATLRFGHDSNIIPLAGLLQIPCASGRDSNPGSLYLTYADWRVSPMAANLQMRLYRNADGEILAKFLLNEAEVPLPDTDPYRYPYYRWSDARATLQRLLDTPVKK